MVGKSLLGKGCSVDCCSESVVANFKQLADLLKCPALLFELVAGFLRTEAEQALSTGSMSQLRFRNGVTKDRVLSYVGRNRPDRKVLLRH